MARKTKKEKASEREVATAEVKSELTGKSKDLFDNSESESEAEDKLQIDKNFAENYDIEKRRKEKESLTARSIFDDDDSSVDSEEDEDGNLLTAERDLMIHTALMKYRSGDKDAASALITGVNTEVKSHLSAILEGEMSFKDKYTMKDYMRDKLLEKGARGVAFLEDDEEDMYDKNRKRTTAEEEADTKAAFLAAADDEEDGFELQKTGNKVVGKSEDYDPNKEKRVNEQLASLFNNVNPKDQNEMFLKNFFMSQGWQSGQDRHAEPTYDEIEEVVDKADEEAEFEAQQIKFEEEYQNQKFRHEEDDNEIKSHPRSHMIEGSLRDKGSRKTARDRKKDRESEVKVKRDEEVKRLKFLKRKEMDEKLNKIKDIAGRNATELFSLADIDEDFNPDDWDSKMSKMFNNDFYDDDDDNFNPADMLKGFESDEDFPQGDDADDLSPEQLLRMDADQEDEEEEKESSKMSKKEIKKELESRKRALLKSKEQEVEEDMENYYKLDYEDVIDGQKVRFKYRSVPGEKFGMTDDDILKYDDRTLNNIAPLKFYAPFRTKSDNTRDRYIAQQNKRAIPEPSPSDEPATKSSKYRRGMEPVFVKYNDEFLKDVAEKEVVKKFEEQNPASKEKSEKTDTKEENPSVMEKSKKTDTKEEKPSAKEKTKKSDHKEVSKQKDAKVTKQKSDPKEKNDNKKAVESEKKSEKKELTQRQQRRQREKPKPKMGKNARKKMKNKQQQEGDAPTKRIKTE